MFFVFDVGGGAVCVVWLLFCFVWCFFGWLGLRCVAWVLVSGFCWCAFVFLFVVCLFLWVGYFVAGVLCLVVGVGWVGGGLWACMIVCFCVSVVAFWFCLGLCVVLVSGLGFYVFFVCCFS